MRWKRVLAIMVMVCLTAVSFAAAQDDVESLMSRAKQLYGAGNFRGALEPLMRVVDVEPERADALYLLGYAHVMLREYPTSVDWFGRAFAADPTFDPRTIYHLPGAAE